MIARRQADVSPARSGGTAARVLLGKDRDIPLPRLGEEAGEPVRTFIPLAEEGVVAEAVEVEIEIEVEARVNGLFGNAPLREQHVFGIVLIEHLPHVPPQPLDARALGVVLDEGGRHIHAEAVASHVHPEAHDVLHRLERRPGCGMFGRELPGLRSLFKAVVERGLRAEEVDHVIAVAVAHAAHPAVALGIDKDVGRPDIAGGILVLPRLLRAQEPRVPVGRMPRHEVEQDLHAPLVRLFKETLCVLVGAVAGSDLLVVAHVVPRIHEGRLEAGIDPEGVAAQSLHIVELLDDALKIADAVGVGIVKALRIDFVKDGRFQPGGKCHISLLAGAARVPGIFLTV